MCWEWDAEKGNEKKHVSGNRNGIEKPTRNAKYTERERITIIKFINSAQWLERYGSDRNGKHLSLNLKGLDNSRQQSLYVCIMYRVCLNAMLCAHSFVYIWHCGVCVCVCKCESVYVYCLCFGPFLASARPGSVHSSSRFLIEQIIIRMHGQVLEKRPNDNCTHFVYTSLCLCARACASIHEFKWVYFIVWPPNSIYTTLCMLLHNRTET